METSTSKLHLIYSCTTILCIFMLVWILVFPASPFVDYQGKTMAEVRDTTSKFFGEFKLDDFDNAPNLPPNLITKYKGQKLVHFTHILPSAFWAACIPLQFHPFIRKNYKSFHKLLGRLFVYAAYLNSLGLCVIISRRLTYEESLDPAVVRRVPFFHLSIIEIFFTAPALPFLYTIMKSVSYARKKDFQNHQAWMVRHVSWGIWVALQRVFSGVAVLWHLFFQGPDIHAPDHVKGQNFLFASILALCVTVTTGEYTVSLLQNERKVKNT